MEKIGNKYRHTKAGVAEIDIGDFDESTTFQPHLKFKKWGDESNFSLELINENAGVDDTDATSLASGKAKWKSDKAALEFFELPDSTEHPGGGFEFNIILQNKHSPNVFNFTIHAKDVAFYRQLPLTERIGEHGIVTADETHGYDADGNVIVTIPANAVNSYAVYKVAPFKNLVGGKDYQSGKVCHIYRPKVYDKDGNWMWCDMVINDNIMTITVPMIWADDVGKYPLTVDPTFGYTTIGTSEVFFDAAGSLCHVGSGLIHDAGSRERAISFHMYGRGTSYDAALYTISGGLPVSRLSPAVTVAFAGANQWNVSSAVSQIMMNGNTYGMAWGNAQAVYVRYDIGTGTQRSACATNLPATWASTGTTAAMYSMYATYETFNEDVV